MVLVLKIKSFCSLILILFFSIHRIGGDGIRIPLSIRIREGFYGQDFYGTISIGTPPQKINISLKFISEYIRVMSGNFTSSICRNQNSSIYNYEVSKSFRSERDFDLYKPPSLYGVPATETITVGDIQIQNVPFFVSDHYKFSNRSLDECYANMGLNYDSNMLLRLCKEIGLKKKFAFYTDYPWNNDTSELMLCGEDKTKFRGNLQYVNATRGEVFREMHISMQSVLLEYNNESIPIMESPGDFGLRPDSPYIDVPEQYMKKIYEALNVTLVRWKPSYTNFDEVDCKTIHQLPSIIFRTADMNFTLTANDYIRQMPLNDQRVCEILLKKSYAEGYWFIGNVFNRKYYTVFDMETNRVGFAESVHGAASTAIIHKVLLITVLLLFMIH